ncbi:MAG TPA: SDR family oxidoreductase [Patescibacteria group bacterium]|nr:SDR family oxidoreductase [Patescibacteria group bacterium]
MNALIIGGSSGLGLELAKQLLASGTTVTITGRKDPGVDGLKFEALELAQPDLPTTLEGLMADLSHIDLFVYAAGFYQEGRVTDLSIDQIETMISVGGRGLIFGLRALLNKQADLPQLITITSSSQYVARQLEPVYNFVKAGAGHFTSSMAEDGRVGKALHVAPQGMQTAFWRDQPHKDVSSYIDPVWAAEQILATNQSNFKYKYIRILRDPARVEEVETR